MSLVFDSFFGESGDAKATTPFPGLEHYMSIDKVADFHASGSTFICSPPPEGSDEDWIVLAFDRSELINTLIEEHGFDVGGEEFDTDNSFVSLRLGLINLVVTESEEFYDRFVAATSVAKRLNLLKKDDRIALFQAVLYAQSCSYGGES